jgi:hypothetical protein
LDVAVFDIEQAIVGNGHAVSVAAHVIDYLSRSGKGGLGVNNPFYFPEWG